ncbi:LysR family transcriptional regulator [Gracilimonas sp.]|uniref:LysR family transcriptional regulator n=1 Tax=Gracilimonas sp. TaxID=1974203 RepID=UPI0032EAC04D
MDKLSALHAFVNVVESSGFSSAARKEGVATSTITRLVNQLEEELDVTLFNRTTREVSLTAAGEIYYPQAKRILQEIIEADYHVKNLDSIPRGELKLYMPVAIGRLCIAPVLCHFLDEYPDIQIEARLTDEPVNLVKSNADVVVMINENITSDLKGTKLAEQKFQLVGSPKYFADHPAPNSAEDIQNHNCLIFSSENGCEEWFIKKKNKNHKIEIKGSFQVNNAEVILEAAEHGLGIALLPDWLIKPSLEKKKLTTVMSDHVFHKGREDSCIYAVYLENRKSLKKVEVFLDFLNELFSKFGH